MSPDDQKSPEAEITESNADPTRCSSCNAEIDQGQTFCTACGAPIQHKEPPGIDRGKVAIIGGVAVVIVAVVIAFAATSEDDDDETVAEEDVSEEAATTMVPEVTTIPTTTTLPLPQGTTWSVSGSDERGYSQMTTITFGAPEKADPMATEPVFDDASGEVIEEAVIKACTVDAATDAVVLVTLSRENTTADFPEALGLVLYQDELGDTVQLATDEDFIDGPQCTSPDTSGRLYSAFTTDVIEPGASTTASFHVVLYDYYSPLNPDGDVAAYQAIQLRPQLLFGPEADQREVDNVVISTVSTSGLPTPQLVAG